MPRARHGTALHCTAQSPTGWHQLGAAEPVQKSFPAPPELELIPAGQLRRKLPSSDELQSCVAV